MNARGPGLLPALLALLLAGCAAEMPRPLAGLSRLLEPLAPSREPALSGRWLALIAQRGGRDQVVLVDVELQRPVPLPGLDRPDAQPLAVAVSGNGDLLALVRQRGGTTELVLHRRSLQASQVLPLQPAGVPRRLSLRADGRELALEVSRDGRWQLDLLSLP
ncbi:MAG: hypothetical protein VKK62_04805 [Synechococcaceae cyanobacterium]|nr:hypothetical protein [Synechococcaceae cyanobacterium]